MCTYRFMTIHNLLQHLREDHKTGIVREEMDFKNFQQFLEWKSVQEEKVDTCYVQHCGARTTQQNTKVWYFYCNRAGKYQPKGKGRRQLKSQGTSKIGEQCSAHLKVVQDVLTGSVKVTYCTTHHNHAVS